MELEEKVARTLCRWRCRTTQACFEKKGGCYLWHNRTRVARQVIADVKETIAAESEKK